MAWIRPQRTVGTWISVWHRCQKIQHFPTLTHFHIYQFHNSFLRGLSTLSSFSQFPLFYGMEYSKEVPCDWRYFISILQVHYFYSWSSSSILEVLLLTQAINQIPNIAVSAKYQLILVEQSLLLDGFLQEIHTTQLQLESHLQLFSCSPLRWVLIQSQNLQIFSQGILKDRKVQEQKDNDLLKSKSLLFIILFILLNFSLIFVCFNN